jgi:surfeit locus 1 family protein
MTRRTGLFLALAALTAALFVRLGFWQLARHAERAQRNATIQASLAEPPLTLPPSAALTEQDSYREVEASGRFDSSHQVLLMNRTFEEQSGYHLVTPLQPAEGGPAVLVDRGWIPQEDGTLQGLERYAVEGEVSLSGVLLPSQAEPGWSLLADAPLSPGEFRLAWRALSISMLQQQFPYTLAPVYIEQSAPLPGAAGPAPIPVVELELTPGPHLGYAFQWFAFAVIAVGGTLIWVRRRRTTPG